MESMDPDAPPEGRWTQVKSVFLKALDIPEAERRAFIADACAGHPDAAREVESLLRNDRWAGSFCETPAAVTLLARGNPESIDVGPTRRLAPGTRLAAYDVVEFIGAGGMGEVYRARDTRLRRDVAIKTIPAAPLGGGTAQRLLKEARHASSLKHPGICTIYEVTESDGVPFIAMELLEGQTLSDLQRTGVPPLGDALRYAIEVADALDHAHRRGIVHRDLKSSNIVIERDGRAVVLDFGVARRLPQAEPASEPRTASETALAGTLTHMAPELLQGEPGDARVDVWSLGVLLYQLVTGRLPFTGRTPFETSSAILHAEPQRLGRHVPFALRLVIERCLVKAPADRYQGAAEVRTALAAILARRGWRIVGPLLIPSRRTRMQVAMLVVLGAILVPAILQLRNRGATPPSLMSTVAILPIANGTGDASQDFYASGMTDALIAQLGAVGDVRVIATAAVGHRTATAHRLVDTGRALGADGVVQGTLRRARDRIRLELTLVRTSSGAAVWSRSFERQPQDVLALQSDAVRVLARAVNVPLRPGAREQLTAPAIRPDVYEAYLKGRYQWNRRTTASLEAAVGHFTRALALDPTYAPAHAALAACYSQFGTVMVGTGSPREYRPRAAAEAIRALQIDPTLSEGYATLGYVRHYQWQWADAERSFLRAIELNPSHMLARLWYANLLMSRQRFDESLRQAYAARDLDPFSLIVNTNIGWILQFSGRHTEAIDHLTRTVALDPRYPQARWRLADALATAGKYDDALAHITLAVQQTGRTASNLSLLATVYARMGRVSQARTVLSELLARDRTQYVPPSTIGSVYAALGEFDTAVDWMEDSSEEGANAAAYFAVDPAYTPLRGHPRFQQLLRRAGLQ